MNKINWNPNPERQKSTNIHLLYWLKPIYAANKNATVKNIRKRISKKPVESSWKLIKYLRPDNEDHDIVKISTMVEQIRKRSKRNTDVQSDSTTEIKSKSSRHQKRSIDNHGSRISYFHAAENSGNRTSKKTSKENSNIQSDTVQGIKSKSLSRHKRSWNIQGSFNPYLPVPKNKGNAVQLAMFYRHPQLTVEEQQHQHQSHQESSKSAKSREPREETTPQKIKTVKPLYKPIFKECNDSTAASEVDDLNIPPPRRKYNQRKKPSIPDIDVSEKDHRDFSPRKIADLLRNKKQERHKTSAPATKTSKSKTFRAISSPAIRPITANGTYVNLRDHQEEAKKKISIKPNRKGSSPLSSGIVGYPKDIPVYNPDNIPYVEVPDYTDQREESLDEDDRRVAKEKYRSNKDERTNEGLSKESDEDELVLDRDEDVVDPDAPLVSDVIPDPRKNPERTSSSLTQNKATGKSESLREGYKDLQVGRKKITLSPDTLPYSDVLARYRNEASRKNAKQQPSEVKDNDKSSEIFGVPGLSTKKDQLEEKSIRDDNEDDYKELGGSGEQDTTAGQKDDEAKSVHFDIDDYIKPFDYDKLFKKDEKKSGEESTDYYPDGSRDVSEKNSSDELSLHEDFYGEYRNPFENDTFLKSDLDNYTNEEAKDIVIVKPEEFEFGDKNFFEPISKKEREKSDRFISGSDFLSSLFSEEEPSELKEDLSDKKSQESSEEEKEETYKPLSSSLEKKDYHSDFNNAPTSKNGKPRPAVYNDFWRLEYSFPSKKN